MEGIYVNFLDQVQFFRFLKGRCHGNQFCGKNYLPPATISSKILVKIVPVVSAENILIDGNCAATWLQFDDRRPFVGNLFCFFNQF